MIVTTDLISRLVPGVVLVLAGTSKLTQLAWFTARVEDYRILPRLAVRTVAISLVVLEVLVGCLLLIGWLRPWSIIAAICLFAVFFGGIVSSLIRSLNIECGCFKGGQSANWRSAVRNVGMILLLSTNLYQSVWSRVATDTAFTIALVVIVVMIVLDMRHERTTVAESTVIA